MLQVRTKLLFFAIQQADSTCQGIITESPIRTDRRIFIGCSDGVHSACECACVHVHSRANAHVCVRDSRYGVGRAGAVSAPRNTKHGATSLGCPARCSGVPLPSSATCPSLNDDGWIGVLQAQSRQAILHPPERGTDRHAGGRMLPNPDQPCREVRSALVERATLFRPCRRVVVGNTANVVQIHLNNNCSGVAISTECSLITTQCC